jgi:hypothetical protein
MAVNVAAAADATDAWDRTGCSCPPSSLAPRHLFDAAPSFFLSFLAFCYFSLGRLSRWLTFPSPLRRGCESTTVGSGNVNLFFLFHPTIHPSILYVMLHGSVWFGSVRSEGKDS